MAYLTGNERALFSGRRMEINQLAEAVELLNKGFPKNLSLIGLRKTGKTLLLRKSLEDVKGAIPVLFNVEDNFSLPEDFALRFSYAIFYSLNQEGNYLPTLSELDKIKPRSKAADEIVNLFISEFEKTKPNRLLLIQKSFELPEKLGKELNSKFVVSLDEFQAILGLNNYREIASILGTIRKSFEHTENVMWIISGSAVSLMLEISSGSKSPFFGLFSNINLDFFSKPDALILIKKIEKIGSATIDHRLKEKIFRFTRGHPFYIYCITDRLCSISKKPMERNLTNAVFEEVLTPNARVYNHCKYVFDTSLERARGKATLKKVLEILSKNELAAISGIAKMARMTIQTVNVSLIRLMEVDLVERINQHYRVCDPLLAFWINNIILEGGDFTRIKEARLKQLEQELLKARTELGKAKEYELKYYLEKEFELKLDKYLEENIEFDLVGKKNGIHYIFEIKWRNKPANYKDVENFLEKTKKSEFKGKKKKLLFLSKSGFTEQAEKLVEKNKIEVIHD